MLERNLRLLPFLFNSTDFMRPMVEGMVDVVAEPVQQGRVQQVWDVRITRQVDGKDVAQGRVRLQNVPLPGAPDGEATLQ